MIGYYKGYKRLPFFPQLAWDWVRVSMSTPPDWRGGIVIVPASHANLRASYHDRDNYYGRELW